MADMTHGKWIIGIMIYFFLFFSVSFITVNALSSYSWNDNININVADPGFLSTSDDRCDKPFVDVSDHVAPLSGKIKCSGLNIDNIYECNNITGCNWKNSSTDWYLFFIFGETGCYDNVEYSFIGYDTDTMDNYCQGTFFQPSNSSLVDAQSRCNLFGCTWHTSSIDTFTKNPLNIVTFLGFITGIDSSSFDIGLPSIFAWIYRILFFYFPLIALFIALMTYVPFIGGIIN